MTSRSLLAALVTAAALAGPRASAQDAEPPYFATAFPGWLQRVAVGADGTVYAAGNTQLRDLPGTVVPPIDLSQWRLPFVSAWAPDGRLLWTTYLPFTLDWADPMPRGLVPAADGTVWVACAGMYFAPDYDHDIAVARLAPDGSILLAEHFGGSELDRPSGLVVTTDGDAIVTGTTWSADFPTTTTSSWDGVGSTAFAARIRADGSGIAWSRLVGTPGATRCTAAAPDGEGGVAAALVESLTPGEFSTYDNDLGVVPYVTDLRVARVSADGADGPSTPLPHDFGATVASLAVGADGSIFASGAMSYLPSIADAFVLRVQPETGTVTGFWKERGSGAPARIAVEPSGGVLVGTDLRHVDPYNGWWIPAENTSRVRRLSPDLREESVVLERDGLRSVEDIAVAPDGALCVVGHGLAVMFNAEAQAESANDTWVARLPSSGATPAPAVEVLRTTRESVELSWSGGDSAASYEVEQLLGTPWSYDLRYVVAATAPTGAQGAVVTGLAPGTTYKFRLVSVFRSGVRSATPPFTAYSLPARPVELSARPADHGVVLRWSPADAAPNSRWEVQRRIGGGTWRRITRSPWDPLDLSQSSGWIVDGLPPLDAGTVTYRIRASLREGRGATAWTYSPTVSVTAPSLRVRQTSGRIWAEDCPTQYGYLDFPPDRLPRQVELSGTFAPTQDLPAPPFDPTRHDFRLWFGAAESPIGIRARAGNWWWRRAGAGWTWSGYCENGARCRLTIDPAAGTFSVSLCTLAPDVGRDTDTVVLGFSYGSWSGGEIRRWTRLPGPRPNLVLR